jgi:NAD(P)-dependent dehydrogenase (short-subunit alcohol dehydrogenase family)
MVILITGANGGLGRAVVQAFLDTGASAVFGVDAAWKGESVQDERLHRIEADLLRDSECRRVVEQAGPVDALVHLLGGFGGGQPVGETPDEVWDKMINLNLRAAFQMFRAVLPRMTKAGRGRIVAVSSRAAVEPMANFAAYSVSKAALITLVKTIALEVKDSGVTANAVLPSIIDTPANRSTMPKADFSKWVKPESIARLLVWLASDAASDVTGAAIPIYGRA